MLERMQLFAVSIGSFLMHQVPIDFRGHLLPFDLAVVLGSSPCLRMLLEIGGDTLPPVTKMVSTVHSACAAAAVDNEKVRY
mmetsp:Transcript_20624/g.42053  ORF Transcript_20624/g.42053 Transcript_20624/m.42053 type:complete len:81 (+) Transcript_20624:1154-1396(+)